MQPASAPGARDKQAVPAAVTRSSACKQRAPLELAPVDREDRDTADERGAPERVGWGFIVLYAVSYTGGSLLFLAPLLVSLALLTESFAHETWDDVRAAGRKSAGLEDLHGTLTRLLNQQHMVFEESWQRLTLAQRAVLRAIVLESGRELLSADVRSRHRLPGATPFPGRRSSSTSSSCRSCSWRW